LIRPLFIVWNRLKPFEQFALKLSLDLELFGSHWNPLYGKKNLDCFHQKPLFIFDWRKNDMTSWMTWGWVNYQQKFFLKWTTPLTNFYKWIWMDII